MTFAILEPNSFSALGLLTLFQRSHDRALRIGPAIQWYPQLLETNLIVIRCRFSVDGLHLRVHNILTRLSEAGWRGSLFLLSDERSWALGMFFCRTFSHLNIQVLEDALSAPELLHRLKIKAARAPSLHPDVGLSQTEFEVLTQLINGLSVARTGTSLALTEKKVSMHKRNALQKLNVNGLIALLS